MVRGRERERERDRERDRERERRIESTQVKAWINSNTDIGYYQNRCPDTIFTIR